MGKRRSDILRGRLAVLKILLTLFGLLIITNLFRIQILNHDYYMELAEKQYNENQRIPASRGSILDRNGYSMATNTIHYDIAVDAELLENKEEIAQICARVFDEPVSKYRKMFRDKDDRHQYLARRIPEEKVRPLIERSNNPGLIKKAHFRRHYPYKTYAAQLIGYTDPDDKGIGGLEMQYDGLLRGRDGKAVILRDGPQRRYFNADSALIDPVPGYNLILTIDKTIQTVVEEELRQGIDNSKAKSGMAIIMDPHKGEILAMANYPTFDPNSHKYYRNAKKRNRTITDVFEPGSTQKLFTAAMLLQENLKRPNDIVFCEQGRYKIYVR
ncbi:MAG: hypothetical protein GF313_15575, partial [Caldithrix sp.]|nr:hypothetical protein [Caldithrix sp.]